MKSERKSKMLEYFADSTQEMKKVTWPTKNQAIRMTILVIVVVLITAMVIAVLDYVFGIGNRFLLDLAPADTLPTNEQPIDLGDITADSEPITVTTADGEEVTIEIPEEATTETN